MTPHEYLHSFTNFESQLNTVTPNEFDLSRVAQLLDVLGNPQEGLRVIHVAGTKGKGSTCAFISYILANAGYRVGLYTSPHLHRLNERIRILDSNVMKSQDDFYGAISDNQLDRIIHQIRPHIVHLQNRGIELTYFEVLTVIALVFFKEESLDYVVLETGLGGRLDATNVVPSRVAVITPISMDHMNLLGKTIAAIAGEKAGIIKNSSQTVVVAPQEPNAMAVIMARCKEFGINPVIVDEGLNLSISLKGDHQRVNAAVAAKAIEALKVFGQPAFEGLVAQAVKVTRWAGRFEILKQDPVIIADGAHNEASALALVKAVRDYYPGHEITVILGMSGDKDIPAVTAEFKNIAGTVILTKSTHPRAHQFSRQEAQNLFTSKPWFVTQDIKDALALAMSRLKKNGVILITGSLFIVAEARKMIHVPVSI